MKKTYIIPSLEVINKLTNNLLSSSIDISKDYADTNYTDGSDAKEIFDDFDSDDE